MSTSGLIHYRSREEGLDELELAIVDVETTGMNASSDRIIEVGVVRVSRGIVVDKFNSLVDPERPISPRIASLTGITNHDVRGAPVFRDIKGELSRLLDGAILVAHNARFDYAFLQKEFEREHITFAADCLCTARLSRLLFPEHRRHNLDCIIERFSLECKNRHRAFDDARVLWLFLGILKENLEPERLKTAVARLLNKPVLPAHLSEADIRRLPDGPGVYVFYDLNGKPLYVGKGSDMRGAVLAHFVHGRRSAKKPAFTDHVADVQGEAACGRLGTLLREANLIDRLSPPFNRRPAAKEGQIVVKRGQDSEGRFFMVEHDGPIRPAEVPHVLGIFTSRRQLKNVVRSAVREFSLCPVRLHADTEGARACRNSESGTCPGECPSFQLPSAHNLRFLKAFAGFGLKPWPFSSPVVIDEKHSSGQTGEAFLLDHWCLVAWLRYSECATEPVLRENPCFDVNRYRIFSDYLASARSGSIREIGFPEVDSLLERFGMHR